MSIADELREVARTRANPELYVVVEADTLFDIANRIDAAHERALAEQFNSLTVDMKPMTEENMAEEGWVRLPVDADGVPIHVGDRLDDYNDTTVVKGLTLNANGWDMVCDNGIWHDPKEFTHHHEPAIEDTLQELLEKAVGRDIAHTAAVRNTITEYAERIKEMTRDA